MKDENHDDMIIAVYDAAKKEDMLFFVIFTIIRNDIGTTHVLGLATADSLTVDIVLFVD